MLKKCVLLFALCLSLCSSVLYANEAKANWILQKFMQVEKNLASFNKQIIEIPNQSSEGGSLEVYRQGSTLKKVVITSYGEMGKSEDNYYFETNELILCRSISEQYQLTNEGKISDKKQIVKQYYLFDQGSLVKPNANEQFNQQYSSQGRAKRNMLIYFLNLALNAKSKTT